MNDTLLRQASEARGSHPYLRPRDAASLIVVEHRAGVPHVLMGRRNRKHVFYPGAYVFPGGRVDRSDGGVPAADEFPKPTAARLLRGMRGRPTMRRVRAFGLTALRETYEEAGLLLGTSQAAGDRPDNPDWRGYFELGVTPALSPLGFVARAITPPGRPRRFDTRFFAVDAGEIVTTLPASRRPTEELSDLDWFPIEEAKALPIPAITRTVLDDLRTRLETPGGLAADVPVPFYHMVRGSFVREFV